MSDKTTYSVGCGCTPVLCLLILIWWLTSYAPEIAELMLEMAETINK